MDPSQEFFGQDIDLDARERLEKINDLDIANAAIRRFLRDRDVPVPTGGDSFRQKVAERISNERLANLIAQYKYAGKVTINYFIYTNISNISLGTVAENASNYFPTEDEVENIVKEPFIAEIEQIEDRLYVAFGFYKSTGGVDPVTGRDRPELTTGRCVAVIYKDIDLVEFRGSNRNMVELTRDELGRAIGTYHDSLYSPDFNLEFQREFNNAVEKYYNLKVKTDDQEGSTIDTIAFTAKEDESGERHDAREDERVAKELGERGGEITMGYVELTDGFKFQINRDQSKLSFRKVEQEENLNEVTRLIDEVLRETGGYTQRTIDQFENVSE